MKKGNTIDSNYTDRNEKLGTLSRYNKDSNLKEFPITMVLGVLGTKKWKVRLRVAIR